MNPRGQHDALVVGAGLAGLVAASALAQRGWRVRVHERANELRMFGAGIWLWENGLRALDAIGALDTGLLDKGQRMSAWEIRDSRSRLIRRRASAPDDRLIVPLRSDLYAALIDVARRSGVEIVTGSLAIRAYPSGEIEFQGGNRDHASLVVAADGVNSALRDSLGLTRVVRPLGVTARRTLIPRLDEESSLDIAAENWSRGRSLLYNPVTSAEIYLCFVCPMTDQTGRAVPFNKVTWKESFPHLGRAIERVTGEGRWDAIVTAECKHWSSGRVAIVGDAAHALPPTLGQAANLAFTNAVGLAHLLEISSNLLEGLQDWEETMRPVTDHTQLWSKRYNSFSHVWPTSMDRMKTTTVKYATRLPSVETRLNRAQRTPPLWS